MIEKININVTPVAEGELPTGVTVKVDGVVYQLGDPVVATAAEPATTSIEGTIEKISVNGVVYDIADVEAVQAEAQRAQEAEKELQEKIDNIKPVIYEGSTINNAPDEEDITSENELLKLKDRSYGDGMGYAILRKNSFAEQVTKANTIYEIRYNFDLNGEAVSIPVGSTLLFNGGCISNGEIIGENTIVVMRGGCISAMMSGTYSNDGFLLTWFGANTTSDCTEILERALRISSNTGIPIVVPKGTYTHKGVIMPQNSCIKGISINSSILACTTNNNNLTIIHPDCEVSNITIRGDVGHYSYDRVYQEHQGNGICIANGSRFGESDSSCYGTKIYNINITKCGNSGLAIIDTQKWVYTFTNVTITYCGHYGFFDASSDNNYIGFNISHCANAGLVVTGSRNRYSTFKVFVCGYDYRNRIDDSPTRPTGVFWQNVRIMGSYNTLIGIDSQESGAELLYVGRNALNNYIQCTLDRPGFGIVSNGVSLGEGKFKPYDIQGVRNIITANLLYRYGVDGLCTPLNRLVLSAINSTKYSTPRILGLDFSNNYLSPITPRFSDINDSQKITDENIGEYVSFDKNKAVIVKTLRCNLGAKIDKHSAVSFAARVHIPSSIDNRIDNTFIAYFGVTVRCSIILYTNGEFQLEMLIPSLNYSSYSEKLKYTLGSYIDIYIISSCDGVFFVAESADSKAVGIQHSMDWSSLRYIAISSSNTCSHIHFAKGISNMCDVTTEWGAYYPFTNNWNGCVYSVSAGSTRPSNVIKGFTVFDEKLGCPIWWDGARWVNGVGQEAITLKKKGLLSQRPDAFDVDIPVGYMYMWEKTELDDVTGGQTPTGEAIPVWWNGNDWQDASGNFVASGTIRDDE